MSLYTAPGLVPEPPARPGPPGASTARLERLKGHPGPVPAPGGR